MLELSVSGRLGADGETKQGPKGSSFYTFRVASSMGKDKETGEEKTTWVSCIMQTPPKAEFLIKKGAIIHVFGTFYGTYTSEKTGQVTMQMRVKDFQILQLAKESSSDDKLSEKRATQAADYVKTISNEKPKFFESSQHYAELCDVEEDDQWRKVTLKKESD